LGDFHQLTRRTANDPALKVAEGMKPRTNADENAAVETNPLSTLPKSWPLLQLRLPKRLRRDSGVEFCVIVEVFFDD
jgi:hypothetical protein